MVERIRQEIYIGIIGIQIFYTRSIISELQISLYYYTNHNKHNYA